MRRRRRAEIWHERPVLAPVIYLISVSFSGAMGYPFGYLLMGRIRYGIGCSLFMSGLMFLYLLESHRSLRRKRDGRESEGKI